MKKRRKDKIPAAFFGRETEFQPRMTNYVVWGKREEVRNQQSELHERGRANSKEEVEPKADGRQDRLRNSDG